MKRTSALLLAATAPALMAAAPAPGTVEDCADAACTVTVHGPTAIPVDGLGALEVTDVGDGVVAFELTSPGAYSSVVVPGGCYAAFGAGYTASFCGASADLEPGSLIAEVVSVEGETAVIALSRS